LDAVTLAFDAGLVPLPLFEGFLRIGVFLEVGEPSAACLVVDPAGVGARRRIDLILVAEYAIGGETPFLPAVDRRLGLLSVKLAAKLHARIHVRSDLELEFEDEISVLLLGAEETVARIDHGLADDAAVLDTIECLPAMLLPTVKILPVEEISPTIGSVAGIG
jgi:hypothetical protein